LFTSNLRNGFLLDLLEIEQPAVRHALLALISVIGATLKGIDYLLLNGKEIVVALINILK